MKKLLLFLGCSALLLAAGGVAAWRLFFSPESIRRAAQVPVTLSAPPTPPAPAAKAVDDAGQSSQSAE